MISANALWKCNFTDPLSASGLALQSADPTRAQIIYGGRDGPCAVMLTTQPGDIGIAGSGANERCDLELPSDPTYGNEGQVEWWAHSLMFPPWYVAPPGWLIPFNFHSYVSGGGQANFQIVARATTLELWVCSGQNVVNLPTDPGFHSFSIGPRVNGVWYDFTYNVKWSSGDDGFLIAYLGGNQVMYWNGPTLYANPAGGAWPAYLKLANYHPPLTPDVPVSVIHSRIVRGASQADVQVNKAAPYVVT